MQRALVVLQATAAVTTVCLSLLLLLGVTSVANKDLAGRHDADAASANLLPYRRLPAPLYRPLLDGGRGASPRGVKARDTGPLEGHGDELLEITFPKNHSWWQVPSDARALKTLPVYFSTHPHTQIPRDSYLEVTGEKLPRDGVRYSGEQSSFGLLNIEPGSYFFTLVLKTWEHQLIPGTLTVLHIEVVVPQQHLHRHWRYVMQEGDRKPVVLLNLPGPPSKNERQQNENRPEPRSSGEHKPTHATARTPVCYVGTVSGSFDGQRKMWLQLMKALGNQHRPREHDSSDTLHAAFDFQVKSFEDFQGSTPMTRALADLNISFQSVQLRIYQEEAHAYGVTVENVHQLVLNQFYEVFPYARNSTSSVSTAESVQLHKIHAKFAVSYWESLVRGLRSCRNGVVIFANSRSKGDNLLVLAARMAGARSIVMELANLYPEPIEVDVVLAPSRFAASHPSVLDAVTFKRSYVLSTGIDMGVFAPRSNPLTVASATQFVIGYVGRLAPEKSVGMILAMARFVVPRCSICRFRIIGDGALKEHLKILTGEWGLTDAVEFLDAIYHDEAKLACELQKMDVYFSPCFFETLGIAGLEAMSVGVPMIGFQTGGVSEYLIDGYNGIALQDTSPEAFHAALNTLIQDPELRYQMGRNARETVLERFSLNKCFPKYAALYQRLGRERER